MHHFFHKIFPCILQILTAWGKNIFETGKTPNGTVNCVLTYLSAHPVPPGPEISICNLKRQWKLKIEYSYFYRDLKASWGQSLRTVSTCRARHQYLKNPEEEKKILKNHTYSLPRQQSSLTKIAKKENKKSRNNFKNQEILWNHNYLYLSQLK